MTAELGLKNITNSQMSRGSYKALSFSVKIPNPGRQAFGRPARFAGLGFLAY